MSEFTLLICFLSVSWSRRLSADGESTSQLKRNQKELRNECLLNCRYNRPVFVQKEIPEKGHGRLEQRKIRVFDTELGHFKEEWSWIQKIIEVTRVREVMGQKAPTKTVHIYISNGGIRYDQFSECMRKHWFIENKNHYVRDETLREDFTVKRRNSMVFATCLSMALNVIRNYGESNISDAVYINSTNSLNTINKYCEFL